ncbi:MAG: alkaline phosphatase [Gemmatimonadetes bacterium]|nr:alkaline phosphatase [Gemmatimonadota bacterium]
MTVTWHRLLAVLFAAAFLPAWAALSNQASAQNPPTRVILIIGDGAGASYWTAAAFASDHLAVEQFPVAGLVDTRASSDKVTDSAAAGTALSSGVRTYNGAIGMDPDSNAVTTVLEVAQGRGMATGLVATSSITHATPASFASHVPNRYMEFEIARQLAFSEVNVLLAGGRRFFHPDVRPDSLDLLSRVKDRYPYVETGDELATLQTDGLTGLVGLFAFGDMPAAAERVPSLPAMTRAALDVLNHDPEGFFLMVEGSQPDWRGHDRDPLVAIEAEMLDLDRAVGVALEYQSKHPETLIVVTADHETGGLAIQQMGSRRVLTGAAATADSTVARLAEARRLVEGELGEMADSIATNLVKLSALLRGRARAIEDSPTLVARYTTGSHTAQMVPLFASGPGSEVFGGIKMNWRIGELLKAAVNR